MATFLAGALGVSLVALLYAFSRIRGCRRLAAETAEAFERRYLATLAASADLVLVVDSAGNIRTRLAAPASPRAPLASWGAELRDVFPADVTAIVAQAVRRAASSTDVVSLDYASDVQGRRHDCDARIMRVTPDTVFVIVRDVTERRRFEQALYDRELALRASYRENLALAGQLIVAQEVERKRIARDLHDDLSQKLALLNIEIEAFAKDETAEAARRARRFRALSAFVSELASEVHALSHELHPSKLDVLGLAGALQSLCREISHKYNIAIDFRSRGRAVRLDPDVSLHIYRIAQEALQNVVKHSRATHARVDLDRLHGTLELRITDTGCGFDTGRTLEGLGLVSIRERAKLIGAQSVVQSSRESGTRVAIRLPLSAGRRLGPPPMTSTPRPPPTSPDAPSTGSAASLRRCDS